MAYQSKVALEQFLDIIKNADATFLNPEKNLDEQGKVDGYHHLFHLLHSAIQFYLYNDPLKPSLMLLADEHHKFLGDNVDAVYYFTQLRSDQEYIIKGKRYDSCYLSFSMYGGEADGSIVDRVTNNINHTRIDFEEDGRFEIKLTQNPQGKNEFKMDEDVVNLFTREYFFDRFNSKESELSIENITPVETINPLTDEALAKRIRIMTTFFEQSTWMAPGFGTVDNVYCFGKFQLEDNQYLKIRLTSPECCYWGIQTWNYLMQSMDYKKFPVSLNKGTTKANEDGSYTIYLSHKKMDVDNWISTANYKESIMFCRWLMSEELPEQPTVEVLEF